MRASGLGLAVGLLFLNACGSDAGTCDTTQPCGGDLVGNWAAHGSCVNQASLQSRFMSELGAGCPSGKSVSILGATTDWARVSSMFNSDGTYSGTSMFSDSISVLVPAECLVIKGCADLDADFRAMVDPATGIQGASCLNAGTGCACMITQQQPTTPQSGTYTTSGTVLTLMPSGGAPTDMPYCVRGSELHLLSIDGSGVIASDIVLVR